MQGCIVCVCLCACVRVCVCKYLPPPHTEQGYLLAESLAKHIYVKLFDWITEQLNRRVHVHVHVVRKY